MIEQFFENTKYYSYPQNSDFNDFPIEYQYRLFSGQTIYHLADNEVEILEVGPIMRSLDKIRYKFNPWYSDFNYLPFDGDERLIARRKLYHINDHIVFK